MHYEALTAGQQLTSYSSTNEAPKKAAPDLTHPAKPAPKPSVASASDVEVEPKAVTPCNHHQHKPVFKALLKGPFYNCVLHHLAVPFVLGSPKDIFGAIG